MFTQTFLLGLSMGGGCLAHCGSVLLPLILCERRKRWTLAMWFLSARLVGYLLFAVVSAIVGGAIAKGGFGGPILVSCVSLLMGSLMIRYGWNLRREVSCEGGCSQHGSGDRGKFSRFRKGAKGYALKAGFLTGISFCTPFMVVAFEGVKGAGVWASIGVFLCFYLGTTLLLIPVLVGGILTRGTVIRQIGFLCSFVCGGLYLLQGTAGVIGCFYV